MLGKFLAGDRELEICKEKKWQEANTHMERGAASRGLKGNALRGLQETRVATREESGVLGFPSRRGLTPRGSLHRILWARTLEWVAIPSSR